MTIRFEAVPTADAEAIRNGGKDAYDHLPETMIVRGYAENLLTRDDIAYIHVRSARNNCYQCRIERG